MLIKNRNYIAVLFGTLLLPLGGVQAAPGVLADKPLFLGTDVQPNILWLVDDSGSMDWENLLTNGAITVHGTGEMPENNSGTRYLDFTPDNNTERRELCSGYNAMAYNPLATYSPWVGLDEDGFAYSNRTLTTALNNPYDNDDLDNVSSHYYYPWNDADSDGVYDNGECPTSSGSRVFVNALSAANQQNYANWYSYYRKREYVAKRALSTIITDSQARMGLATLHNNNLIGTIVKDVDNISVPVDAAASSNKTALLRNLFRINSSGGTPLRQNLQQAGNYFRVGVNPGTGLFGFTPNPTSPILSASGGGECQQNFTILMSDGFWNGSSPSVGNADANSVSPYDGGSYADGVSNTLADVAMWYYKNDLAPVMDDNVPVITGVDENEAQHMVTYTVAFGVNGTLSANPVDKDAAFAWPTPSSNNPRTIDDMRHAAWNGRGEFLSAGDPDSLISSLQGAINDIADRDGAASAVAFNSTSLGTDTLVFQARFDSGGWHGSLLAFDFDSNGVGNLEWDAADVLNNRDLDAQARNIITYNGTQGVPFQFPADYSNLLVTDISADQVSDLLADAPFDEATAIPSEIAANQVFGQNIVSFLRGKDDNEVDNGGVFRDRFDKRLGDIVHSSPSYVGAPGRAYPNFIEGVDHPYSDFILQEENRDPLVYVGGNDGMLHAFDADDGDEVFAYIPGFLFDDSNGKGLHYLADTSYSHIAYVDESPLAADVFINGAWRTYLIGGLRAGGKGVYVIDITDPSSLSEAGAASIVKQEFTHPQLGYTFSRPLVGKMNNGRWAAIFGNGYNGDGDGAAKLFVLYLDSTGGFELIDTASGAIANSDCNDAGSDCNGLSSPTVLDMTGDGTIDRVYAGDLHGNMWAFDLSNKDSTKWDVAYSDTGSPVPLFSACGGTTCTVANRQPITSLPVVRTHPSRLGDSTEPNLMVYFGTGQWISENDNLDVNTQTMYGVWDAGVSQLTRNSLQQQVVSGSATVTGGRDLSTNDVDYVVTSELGWFIDLPDTGERVVVEAVSIGNIVFFNTTVPDSGSCNGGGYGYLMFADRMTGGQPDFTVLDINNDGTFDDDIVAGIMTNAIPGGGRLIDDRYVVSDSSGKITDVGVQTGASRPSSRSSWSIIR
ncbi:PilC/PilY family type IV pilus protein [Maricurvus nonylphenolicus]|uniref:pilus assembly protein n=1 Tax=Maricurvus nonylphenolicus TaxID=1008307 RepID=UPI0036F36732